MCPPALAPCSLPVRVEVVGQVLAATERSLWVLETFHPPTVYFPTIVKEAMMVEPTETESKETLDAFADALRAIRDEALTDPDVLHEAPHSAPAACNTSSSSA